MKHARYIPFLPLLLSLLTLAASPLAKATEDRQTEKDPSLGSAISAARGPYTENAGVESISRDPGKGTTLAQFSQGGISRGRPARPFPPHHGYPRGSYQSPWRDHGSAGHAAIGAVIGFGLGAALGAAGNTDRHAGTTRAGTALIIGGLGAFIGGVIGGAHGGPYGFAHHRKTPPPALRGDEEPDLNAHFIGSHSEDRSAEQMASAGLVSHSLP